jgi:hypothetical protein
MRTRSFLVVFWLVGYSGIMPAPIAMASATTGLTTPYLQSGDSSLLTTSAGYKLEAFESNSPSLASLGVSLTTVHPNSIDQGLSVDADDGVVDGSGAGGHSLTVITMGGTTGATFSFNSAVIGAYPKSAGVAVTAEAATSLIFTVYDTSNAVSGSYSLSNIATSGPTGDDFLFWGSDASGISAISVSSPTALTALHLDHLQYDTLNTISVPDPSMMGFLAIPGLLGMRRGGRRCAV